MKQWFDDELWIDYIEDEVPANWKSDLEQLLNNSGPDREVVGHFKGIKQIIREDDDTPTIDVTDAVMHTLQTQAREERALRKKAERIWRAHASAASMVAGLAGLLLLNFAKLNGQFTDMSARLEDKQRMISALQNRSLISSGLTVLETEMILKTAASKRVERSDERTISGSSSVSEIRELFQQREKM